MPTSMLERRVKRGVERRVERGMERRVKMRVEQGEWCHQTQRG